MEKMIIEVRANEYTMRVPNPNVPWSAKELEADARHVRDAGAAIYHFHARTPEGGHEISVEAYADIVGRIRAGNDILLHPTLGANMRQTSAEDRLNIYRALVSRGLVPDIGPIDMATSNIDQVDLQTWKHLSGDRIYVNTTETMIGLARGMRAMGVTPKAVIYHIPSLRHGIAMARAGEFPKPLHLEFALSGGATLSTHPSTPAGLDAYLAMLPDDVPVAWTALSAGVSILPLVEMIARRGGHVAIGIGDYHYTEEGLPDNTALVSRVVEIARSCGREIASPDEARRILAHQY